MNESAYRVLLDERDVRDPNSPLANNRRERTKNLLSGGTVPRPSLVDQIQDYAPQVQPMNNYAPINNQPPVSFYPQQHFQNQNFQPFPKPQEWVPPTYQRPFQNSFTNSFQPPFAAPRRPDFLQSRRRSTSKSSRDSGRYRKTSKRKTNRYGISDDEDDSDDCEDLTSRQKKKVLQYIEEFCPSSMSNAIHQNILDAMEKLDKKGFRLPKDYDKSKHDLNANEMQLFGQQVAKEKDRDRNKAINFIGLAANGLKWFCKVSHIDIINADTVPNVINQSIYDGEFEDSLEGLGNYLRDTVFENPIVSAAVTFIKKVGDASNDEIERENEKLEEEQLRREDRHKKTPLTHLNNFKPDEKCFDLPVPKSRKPKQEETTIKKKPSKK
jgi:hypothetical protein